MNCFIKIFAVCVTLLIVFSNQKLNAIDKELNKKKIALYKSGQVKDWPKRSWSSSYIYNTTHYNVKSNTSYETCRYIGTIMELIYKSYRELFDYKGPVPRLKIYAYARMEEFREDANKLGVNQAAGGFYTPQEGGAIYLPYQEVLGHHPSIVLYHEGAHQFVQEAINMKIPKQYKNAFNEGFTVASSTPIWLNEGIATYLETALYNGRNLDIGRVNVSRLTHLQYMIDNSIYPDVEEVLSRKYGQPFSKEHYAVAWGLVYYLRHDADAAKQNKRRAMLGKYLDKAKRAFLDGDYRLSFRDTFIKNGKCVENFDVKWRVHIGKMSFETFKEIIVGKNKDFKVWEKEWLEWVKNLNPNAAYGGTYTGESKRGGSF